MKTKKLPFRYYGGKIRMLPHILPLIPPHRVYVEAFVGGGAVFWAKKPSTVEVLNDTDNRIETFYRVGRECPDELARKIAGTLHSENEWERAKTILKAPEGHAPLDIAWAVWASVNLSIGGLMAGRGSFQFVLHQTDNWNPASSFRRRRNDLKHWLHRLEDVTIHSRDAVELIRKRDHADVFFYLDPPYVDARQGHYGGYKQEAFSGLLDECETMKGKFLLSSYPNAELSERVEANGWNQLKIKKAKGVANHDTAIEVLTWNYDEPKELRLFR